jgi:hypothetical protein
MLIRLGTEFFRISGRAFLNKHSVSRTPQAAKRRMLARRRHCAAFASALSLQALLRMRVIRNLYLAAKVWCVCVCVSVCV